VVAEGAAAAAAPDPVRTITARRAAMPRNLRMSAPFGRLLPLLYPVAVKTVQGDWKGSVRSGSDGWLGSRR
jgi:hypothetical protein